MRLLSWLLGRKYSPQSKPSTTYKPQPSAFANKLAPINKPKPTRTTKIKWRDGSYPMEVVGESNYQEAIQRVCGKHNRNGYDFKTEALVVREPSNPYDLNAVAVKMNDSTIGYLPRAQAQRVSEQMKEDGIAHAACSATIVGGWRTNQHDEGHFGVRLAIPRMGWIDFGLGKPAPSKQSTSPNKARKTKPPRPEAAEDGPLKGHWVVVWGAPDHGDIAHELARQGAHIMAGVGRSTTLVVQVRDELTQGMEKSSIFKKAQDQIEAGSNLKIVTLAELRESAL